MVLEHLFPEDWLEKKIRYSFILAFVYSSLSIVAARLLFKSNSGIVSIAFTSLLLLPYLEKLFEKEEKIELKEKSFTLRKLFRDNRKTVKVYFSLFFGIYLAYLLFSFILPQLGIDILPIFKEQLRLEGVTGNLIFTKSLFIQIFLNNWWVLLACFLLSLMTGDGAIFFITWNASTWGTILGYRALAAGLAGYHDPWTNLLIIVVFTLPHLVLEGGAYILAAISGSVISDDIISKSQEIRKFLMVAAGAGIGYFFLFILIRQMFSGIFAGFLNIALMLFIIHSLNMIFDDKKHKEVFVYNYYLLVIAILIFMLGALVETFVLGNIGALTKVYAASSMFAF
ncbi:stage II sporulation protein M [Candidatus Woesearchaeota archaeon]|nr:stage II sporulation protein M [Candidatus Woesearchaeota archaeon]